MSSIFINALAANIGVLSHLLYFKRGEHHMHGVLYLQVFLLLNGAAVFALSRLAGYEIPQAFSVVSSASFFYLLSVNGSALLYRAFFHPLRNFPGPFMARLSNFWWPTRVTTNADAPYKLEKLHEKYGQFLRIGPNTLSIIHPDGPQKVYGLGTKCSKGPWYDQDYPLTSLHTSRKRDMHDQRRKIWSPAFSDKALRGYEERMKPYENRLVEQLRAFGGVQPVNVSDWFNYFSYDVMGDLAFGESFDMLEKGEEHWAIALLNAGMEPMAAKLPPWVFRVIVAIPGAAKDYWKFINYCSEQMQKRMEASAKIPDITSALLEPFQEKGSLREPEGLELTYLQGDSRLVIVAGSDTTAATLTHLFYHLAAEPSLVQRLRRELKPYTDSEGNVENSDIANNDYLNGCIFETLRLHPPVPSAINRSTPPEGIEIGSKHIPGNADVFCPQYVIGRSDICYKDPQGFVPERWYEKTNMVTNRTAFSPFSQGVYGCIGRPLAMLEIRTTVAKLLHYFDVDFAPGEDGRDLLYKTRDHFTLGLAPLKLRFNERKERRDSAAPA
ncbi:cytochrome P450 [Rhizodiscina lignyota]|uniref:Cytochrome P450 n=1 Tax=Rhizodiscina lignyota TaxID=1504668 RepID=A0A9P4ICC3_9PEZI|nr:cytochrome P450 [Rhizodiscina lignyota]